MSWEGFWYPHLLQATLFAGLSAIVSGVVGTIVGLIVRWAWLKWIKPWIKGVAEDMLREQRALSSSADEAVAASKVAAAKSTTASENSSQAAVKLEIVGARLKAVLDENSDMAKRLDGILAAYVRLRIIAREQGVELPAELDTEDVPGLTTTGRHLLSKYRAAAGIVQP